MVAKPAAVPRSNGVRPEQPAGGESRPPATPGKTQPPPPSQAAENGPPSNLESSGFVFSESSLDFQVESDIDPVDAEAEEAAVLFANGQDDAARAALENAVRKHQSGPAERLWLMLFDLYRITGKRALFDALGAEYARAFEKPPPAWGELSKDKRKSEVIAGSLTFRGELSGDNTAPFDAIRQYLEKNAKLRVDFMQIGGLDAPGCRRLLALLQQARKAKREVELLGRDRLRTLLEQCIAAGRPEDKECWLLLLELYQLQGLHEDFDEVAINYAVAFEVSPPSWEANRVAAPEPARQFVAEPIPEDLTPPANAYVLRGDIRALRFGDLPAYTEAQDPVLIECGELRRIDFISAGALLNVLTTVRRSGKQIVFRHPNHLVAELFGVVGLKAVATVILAKH